VFGGAFNPYVNLSTFLDRFSPSAFSCSLGVLWLVVAPIQFPFVVPLALDGRRTNFTTTDPRSALFQVSPMA
jgi:hypothetical protein